MSFYIKRNTYDQKVRIYDVFMTREKALKSAIVYNLFDLITDAKSLDKIKDAEIVAFIKSLKGSWDSLGTNVRDQLKWRQELIEMVNALDDEILQAYFDATQGSTPCQILQVKSDELSVDRCFPDLDSPEEAEEEDDEEEDEEDDFFASDLDD